VDELLKILGANPAPNMFHYCGHCMTADEIIVEEKIKSKKSYASVNETALRE
jgi:hypothetical protein